MISYALIGSFDVGMAKFLDILIQFIEVVYDSVVEFFYSFIFCVV